MVARRWYWVAGVMLAARGAFGAATYTLTDIGTLDGYLTSAAWGINANGDVAATATDGYAHRAFVYAGGVRVDLSTLGGTNSDACGINGYQQVVGYSDTVNDAARHAFLWTDGQMTDLGVVAGGSTSFGRAVNLAGQVVGSSNDANGQQVGTWFGAGGTRKMALPATQVDSSFAFAVNASGQVAGKYYLTNSAGGEYHAFRFSGGNLTDLTTLGGSYSSGQGINDAGHVVGWSYTAKNMGVHAFVERGTGGMVDLGVLTGGTWSAANAINNSGIIVGTATLSDGTEHAFVYRNGAMTDLNTLVLPSTWTLMEATGINDAGQICGLMTDVNGVERGFVLTPVPEAGTLGMLMVGAAIFLRRRDVR